jgi:N6-L-threonylcarbamoyladenine synthase
MMNYPRLDQNSIILGIESSCDDTSAAVLKNGKVVSNITATQEIHQKFGGVVPELASRAHQSHIIPVIQTALTEGEVTLNDLDAIAVTQGPGLMGSLVVGLNTAKGLSLSLNKPLIGVNHLHAHIAALHIEHQISFPMLCLLVSGGHTQLIWNTSPGTYEIVGETIDDAVGEAFDKGSKIMGLGYPGGPLIAKLAESGNEHFHNFPDSQTDHLDFSFSGIKTSLLYFLRKSIQDQPDFLHVHVHDVCASYEKSLVTMLIKRLKKAQKIYPAASMGLVGGVSANKKLREAFQQLGSQLNVETYVPSFEYCTDNAAMIAQAGLFLGMQGTYMSLNEIPYTRSK